MTIRKGETGKRLYVITSFDMGSRTNLTIIAVPPSGETNQKEWAATLGATLADVTLEDGTVVESVAASQSMYYDLADSDDLDEAGVWRLVGRYKNTGVTPTDSFLSDPVSLTVSDDNIA